MNCVFFKPQKKRWLLQLFLRLEEKLIHYAAKLLMSCLKESPLQKRFNPLFDSDLYSWEIWRGHAVKDLTESLVVIKEHSENTKNTKNFRVILMAIIASFKGFFLGYMISLAVLIVMMSDSNRFDAERLILNLLLDIKDLKKNEEDQFKAKHSSFEALPQFKEIKEKPPSVFVLEVMIMILFAPLFWSWILASQAKAVNLFWSELYIGLERALCLLNNAKSPEHALEAWLSACRWYEIGGGYVARSKIYALACCSLHSGLKELVRDCDAGWRRVGDVYDERVRRLETEESLKGLASSFIMSNILSEAKTFKNQDRRLIAVDALDELSRDWIRMDHTKGSVKRWADLVKSASLLLCEESFLEEINDHNPKRISFNLSTVDPWVHLETQVNLFKNFCEEKKWPQELREVGLTCFISNASFLGCKRKQVFSTSKALSDPLEQECERYLEYCSHLITRIVSGLLSFKQIAEAMSEGFSRDVDWRLRMNNVLVLRIQWHCQKASAELERLQIEHCMNTLGKKERKTSAL